MHLNLEHVENDKQDRVVVINLAPNGTVQLDLRTESNGMAFSNISLNDAQKIRDMLIEVCPLPKDDCGTMIVPDPIACMKAFDLGIRLGVESATIKPSHEPQWEIITDGLDRCKVEGGYIYQTDEGAITFVPDQP